MADDIITPPVEPDAPEVIDESTSRTLEELKAMQKNMSDELAKIHDEIAKKEPDHPAEPADFGGYFKDFIKK